MSPNSAASCAGQCAYSRSRSIGHAFVAHLFSQPHLFAIVNFACKQTQRRLA
jgi:hypothetical protein